MVLCRVKFCHRCYFKFALLKTLLDFVKSKIGTKLEILMSNIVMYVTPSVYGHQKFINYAKKENHLLGKAWILTTITMQW